MRDRALEKVKASVFMGSNAAFLGCLLCGLNFRWTTEVETAGVNNTEFVWNPDWFDSLTKEERKGVLLHELWHLALLHGLRQGDRDPIKWNAACDYRINANLIMDGYTLPEGGLYSEKYKSNGWSEEMIYDDLPDMPNPQSWGESVAKGAGNQVALVQAALTSTAMAGTAPGDVSKVIKDLLKPKLPWKTLLHKYLLEKFDKDYSLERPNRRFQDIYLPSLRESDGRLINIAMYLDTSGSITEEEIKRFITEVKYVKEHFNPQELRIVQFDTEIQHEDVYNESSNLKAFNIEGFGGTDLECVRNHILKHKPALSIIFSDLYVDPMEPVGKLDVLWISSSDKEGPFGVTIHV